MRWCARCRRRLYDRGAAFCPFDGTRLDVPSDDDPGASDPYLGSTLQGQFHLIEAIGSGAMGSVYRAWQSGMERAVAIKLLRADLLGDDELRRRFLREGRAAARLNHPNIVSVYTVGETEAGVPYLVMEHLSGQTLDELIEAEPTLPPARAADIARQIASALAEAHAAGIVHRDLKPGNVVLLQRRGAGELVKIFDFGIAKIADGTLPGGDASRLTRDGAIFGTPHYIAPEQAQGGALDGRADLYSLGILLYRMLSGRLPFEGNAVAVLLAHIGRAPTDLAQVAPDLDPALAALVMRCLEKNPDRRFATADDLIDALELVTSRAPRAATSPRRAPSNPPRVVEAVGEVAVPVPLAPAADTAGASWTARWPRARLAASAMPRPVRRRGGGARAALAGLAVVILGSGTGAAALLRGGARDAAAGDGPALVRVETPQPAPQHSAPAPRAVVVSDDGHSVRALLPEPVRAGRAVEILFDVWDPGGAPLQAPALPVELASLGAPVPDGDDPDTALAARPVPDQPGRYRLVARFPAPGEAAVLLELAGGSYLHWHFEVAPP